MLQFPRWSSRPSLQIRLLLISAMLMATAAAATPSSSTMVRDGVVVDVERSMAFLAAPDGGIEAVDLTAGAVVWTSKAADKPLAVTGDLLIAQAEPTVAGSLEIAALPLNAPNRRSMSASVPLPEGLWSRLDNGLSRTFQAWAQPADGELLVVWNASQNSATLQGYLRSEREGQAPRNLPVQLEGAATIDLASGRVAEAPIAEATVRPRTLAVDTPHTSYSRTYLSADGRHVLSSQHSANRDWTRAHRWTIEDRATGQVIGEIDHFLGTAPFVVVGRSLIFESRPHVLRRDGEFVSAPLEVRAVDLTDGTPLWTRELRDAEFRGPFPH
ncbi:MAG: hypothetical protein AAGN66_26460 [Acidobacteriota bacterium]